jgi:5-methylcytosine-specific restriction endonuclease McrA
LTFQVDHIIAEQHRGKTRLNNLCLACPRCNAYKGPNISGIDEKTRQLTPLFHPRRDRWEDHFAWHGPRLRGLTPIGRVTISVLGINQPEAVAVRKELRKEGRFPPGP